MLIHPVIFVQPGPNLRPISSTPKTVEWREAAEFSKSQFFLESLPPEARTDEPVKLLIGDKKAVPAQ
jgi:hypothetical protein